MDEKRPLQPEVIWRPPSIRLILVMIIAGPVFVGMFIFHCLGGARPPLTTFPGAPECRVTEVHATVARAVAETWFSPSIVARTSHIVPALVDGRAVGFSIQAIRPGSALAMIGLQEGDVVHRVEGLSLATTAEALEAYTRLRERQPDRFTLEITRRGCPLVLVVAIT